jgi:5-methylcytosine-specific restriction endonuclease McrA
MTTSCILLNADYTFLNVVHWKRAICLLVKGKAEALSYSDHVVRNAEETHIMKIPSVLKLVKLIRYLYRNKVPFSKKNIFIRDGYTCVYCDSKDGLTIDHIIPVSRGGKSTFENCVAACRTCNHKKGNKTPSEANMYMKKQPYAPTISEFIYLRMKKMGITDLLKDLGVF